jgi:uncharacterized protein involved in response to NO
MIVNLEPTKDVGKFAFLHLGFRPFFLGASGFAVLSMLMWMAIYIFGWNVQFKYFSTMTWHAHEMIFGYTLAVAAGFLLTAIKNWTNLQTIHGYKLLSLFLLWLLARCLPYLEGGSIFTAIIDNLFIILLIIAVALPLLKAKHWKSLAFVLILVFLLFSNIVFYLGAFKVITNGEHYGLYMSLYLILGLIFIMGRRVIPFFIERGVDETIQVKNWSWIDKSHLPIFIVFGITDLIEPYSYLTAVLAGLLGLIHTVRLYGWYTKGIWKKTLLWILYLSYVFIVLGFVLKALSIFAGISVYLSVHAFTFGGIGLITIGMMSRVSLGHTGRLVSNPPQSLFWIFGLLLCGAIIRVIFPLIDNSLYIYWMGLSQILWIIGFAWFFFIYFPMLIYPRTDGRYG